MKEIKLFGATWCNFCNATKKWLQENNFDYQFIDVDIPGNREEMKKYVPDNETIPVVVIDGKGYVNPEHSFLHSELEVGKLSEDKVYDVIGIGAGPTALSAAIYTTREDLSTLLVEKAIVGGLAAITDQVDNYPGFPEGVTGMALAENLEKQAVRFGTNFEYAEVTGIEDVDGLKIVHTTSGDLKAKSVLIATGSDYKKLGIPGEMELYGRGVHYCATCDGPIYRDKSLVVVGGGNSAVQEAIFLTKFASRIDLLVRSDKMRASEVLQKELQNHSDKIKIHYNTKPLEIKSEDGKLASSVLVEVDGKTDEIKCDGVFVFIGLKPTTGFLNGSVELDDLGFVKTDSRLETSINGVFAAGDVRSGATMQIASAVGEGATAALMIREYLKDR